MNNKLHYTWDEFDHDVETIVQKFGKNKPHVVGIHRGSLPLAVKLSNVLNNGMSIIKFQTRSGNDKIPKIILHEIPDSGPILVVDDIVDSGYTFEMIHELLCVKNCEDVKFLSLHNNNLINKRLNFPVYTLRETDGKWVVYPWE